MDYRTRFELLIAPSKNEEKVMLESIFLNGLKEEIRAELKLHEPRSLAEIMDRALLLEEKNLAFQKGKGVTKERGEWGAEPLYGRTDPRATEEGPNRY